MVLKQMGASVCVWEVYNDLGGFKTKSESKLRVAILQLASRKGKFIEMILGIQDTRIRANAKISVTGPKKSEVISSQFHTLIFHSLFFVGLSLTTFFRKASTPSEGVQATCPRVLYPEGISNNKRKN